MENRIAFVGIVVEDLSITKELNELLNEYSEYIIGRLGVPYRNRKVSVMSIILDAPNDVVSALTGKLGMLELVSVKTSFTKQ